MYAVRLDWQKKRVCFTVVHMLVDACICCLRLGIDCFQHEDIGWDGLTVMYGARFVVAADNHSQGNKGEHGDASQGANYGEQGSGSTVALCAWSHHLVVIFSVTTRWLRSGQSRNTEWLLEAGSDFPCIVRWGAC